MDKGSKGWRGKSQGKIPQIESNLLDTETWRRSYAWTTKVKSQMNRHLSFMSVRVIILRDVLVYAILMP
ncbi:hypothetical protein M8J76_014173 [Diaphorina citri]|nr:hypothetical protein M8J76_014173 [Diaphorina citri]